MPPPTPNMPATRPAKEQTAGYTKVFRAVHNTCASVLPPLVTDCVAANVMMMSLHVAKPNISFRPSNIFTVHLASV